MNFRDRIIDFRRVKASELLPHDRNWRTHPQAQHDALCGVLAEIGWAGALVARELSDGTLQLIDGHLRAEVGDTVPVLVLDVDEAEAEKLLASLDPLAAMAGTNAEQLDALLKGVTTDSPALAAMFAATARHAGLFAEPAIEDEPPEPSDLVTQPGDLWLLGDHRLLCGDSTNAAHVATLLDGAVPFLMVTDPPYGVNYDPEWREGADLGVGQRSKGKVENDDCFDWTETYRLFPGSVAYVWHASFFTPEVGFNLKDAGFEIRASIIWTKQHFVLSQGHYHWQHEPCWYVCRKGHQAKWCGDRTQSTLWQIKNNNSFGNASKEETWGHGTQKPVECMARPIRNHGGNDDDVYDPFLGSGTTLIAAEQLGRRCFGMELSPTYCDMTVQRWEKLSGKKATRG